MQNTQLLAEQGILAHARTGLPGAPAVVAATRHAKGRAQVSYPVTAFQRSHAREAFGEGSARMPKAFFKTSQRASRLSFLRRKRVISRCSSSVLAAFTALLPRPALLQSRRFQCETPSSAAISLNGLPLLLTIATALRRNSSSYCFLAFFGFGSLISPHRLVHPPNHVHRIGTGSATWERGRGEAPPPLV